MVIPRKYETKYSEETDILIIQTVVDRIISEDDIDVSVKAYTKSIIGNTGKENLSKFKIQGNMPGQSQTSTKVLSSFASISASTLSPTDIMIIGCPAKRMRSASWSCRLMQNGIWRLD